MSIFREFGGRASYYTSNELDRLQNPDKYDYDQAGYDSYSASVQKKHDARQAADTASRDAIPYSYVGRGTGDTNPAFSFAGYSGHTSGGTAGNVNLAGTAGGGNMQYKAEGGVIYPVQHMEAGGMIVSPFANPMKSQMGNKEMVQPMMQSMGPGSMPSPFAKSQGPGSMRGVGGMFENMQKQFGQQMSQMQSSPLKVYGDYLNQTYTGAQEAALQSKVTEFVDLVDQAERAHFGAEESFGYGKPAAPPQAIQGNDMGMPSPFAKSQGPGRMHTMGPGSMSGGSGIASLPNAF